MAVREGGAPVGGGGAMRPQAEDGLGFACG